MRSTQFRLFRDSNRDLYEAIRLQRDAAREASRPSAAAGRTASRLSALVWRWASSSVAGGCCSGSVSGPLERLRSVVERQRDGDRDALADTESGAVEVRSLAADFNGLTRVQPGAPGAAGARAARPPAGPRRRPRRARGARHRHRPRGGGRDARRGPGGRPHPALHARRDAGRSRSAPSGTATTCRTCPSSRPRWLARSRPSATSCADRPPSSCSRTSSHAEVQAQDRAAAVLPGDRCQVAPHGARWASASRVSACCRS